MQRIKKKLVAPEILTIKYLKKYLLLLFSKFDKYQLRL